MSRVCNIYVLSLTDRCHIRTETYLKKLAGRTDIEDAFKRLDDLTREEVQLAIALILKATKELKDGAQSHESVIISTLNFAPPRCHEIQQRCGTDGEHGGRNKA